MVNLTNWGDPTGGAQNQLNLFRAWREAGHEVRMLSPQSIEWSTLAEELKPSLLVSRNCQFLGLPANFNTLFQIPQLVFQRILFRPDVVYSRANTFTALLVVTCRLLGMKVIVEHNSWLAKERIAQGSSRLIGWLEEWLQITSARWSHASRCVTRGLAAQLQKAGVRVDRLYYVGNGTDVSRFHPIPRIEALQAFNLRPEKTYIGFIGNIMPWHGLKVAIEAFSQLATRRETLELLIFGEGPPRVELEAQARCCSAGARIHFFGRVPAERANLAINCFDIALLPVSQQYNVAFGFSSTKIRDYAAAGRLVVAGHLPGNIELAEHKWLFTHTPDDPSSLADVLDRLLADRSSWPAASHAARRYAEEHFSWGKLALDLLGILERATNNRGNYISRQMQDSGAAAIEAQRISRLDPRVH
jgi:glycosyltransferase involved in cell wall biosynthesis